MLNMGRCLAWFFEFRSYLAYLGSIIVLVVNSFFVIYLPVNDPIKTMINNKFTGRPIREANLLRCSCKRNKFTITLAD